MRKARCDIFCFIDDVIDATILGSEKKKANYKIFNVDSGSNISISKIAYILRDAYKSNVKIKITGDYRIGVAGSTTIFMGFDSVSTTGASETITYTNFPSSTASWSETNVKSSIYATYTAGGDSTVSTSETLSLSEDVQTFLENKTVSRKTSPEVWTISLNSFARISLTVSIPKTYGALGPIMFLSISHSTHPSS